MEIGERIHKNRTKNGLTLAELADKLGKTEATIQRYESGNIKNLKNDTIEQLAKILNVTPAYLMGWENAKEENKDFIVRNLVNEYNLDDLDRQVIEGYLNLNKSQRKSIKKYVLALIQSES